MDPESNYENLESSQDVEKENVEKIEEEINQFKESIKAKFEEKDCEKILSALDLMLYLHCNQEDRIDGKPYITHPLEVADDLVNKYDIDDADLVVGALLHDSVEDQADKLLNNKEPEESKEELQKAALTRIGDIYGKRIESIIKGLTNPDFDQIMEELESKGIKKEKRELYKEHIKEAIKNSDVFVIKLSDFIRNAGNIPKEGNRRNHFIKKYGPVIKEIFIPAFEKMTEEHPLYKKRSDILVELNNMYEAEYVENL